MIDATAHWAALREATDERAEPKRRRADWLLIGDILGQRAGVPEHLVMWRSAEGDDDLPPMI